MPKINPQRKPKSQRDAFIEAARNAECDESEAAFENELRKIAKAKGKSSKKAKR